MNTGKVDVLLGLQWGDEGKGKVVDVLTPKYDVIARFQGGPNAGHTLEFEGQKYVLRSIPSGIFQGGKVNIIGNGVVLAPDLFMDEAKELEKSGHDLKSRLYISKKAHLIMPTHRVLDRAYESLKGDHKVGTTGKGIGPTYTDKISRNGLRVGDIFEDFERKYAEHKARHEATLKSLGYTDYDISEDEKRWMEGVERLARHNGHVKKDKLEPARCPLLGYALKEMVIEGQPIRSKYLRTETQDRMGKDGYDAGAKILTDFFAKELDKFYTDDLDPLGREIIDCFRRGGTIEDYCKLTPMKL